MISMTAWWDGQRDTRGPKGWVRFEPWTRAGALAIAVGFGTPAIGLGLGDPSVASSLGQTLQMTVPLAADPGVELSQDCVRLVPSSETGDPIPSLGSGRITIEPERGQLRIESVQPIGEPALRVVVEVGCAQRIRRSFTLLLDPPAVPLVAGADSPQQGSTTPPLGLGMAQISAVLGQRLSLKVPVVGAGAGNLTADCVRLSDPISSEGAPVLRQASIKVVQQETGPLIEVVTSDPVTEPAVRLALDVGCSDPLRREYAILLGLPPLAAAGPAAEAAVPSEPAAPPVTRPVPKRAAPTPPHAAALPVAPTPESAAVKPAPVRTEQPPVPKPATRPPEADRLVLSAPQQAAPAAAAAAEAQALQNAELLKRLDTMSKEIEMLRAELNASRQHEREMERRLSESREGWTWLMGAMGGVLLGGALVIAWRRQRSPQPSWEPSASAARRAPTTIAPAPRAAVAAAAAVPGIGGRATMAPAPTTINATTDMPDERHTDITVTELHDTVQVIKELYATVLERNTSSAAPAGGQRRPRPLDLDLKPPPASSPEATPPQVLGDAVQGVQRPTSGERLAEAQDPQFTELPTEVAMDLDLSTLVIPAAPMLTAEELAARNAGAPASHAPQPGLGDSSQATAAPGAVAARRAPASDAAPASRIVLTELPTRAGFADDQLTQTPTEVSIDIDLGEPSRNTVNQPATRVVPLQRADAERKNTGPAPFDLQLDLDQPETKNKPRGEKSA